MGSVADWVGNFLTVASVSTALYFGLRVPKSKILFDFKETTKPENYDMVKDRFGYLNIYNQDFKDVILRIIDYSGCDISITSSNDRWEKLAGGTDEIKDSWLKLGPTTSGRKSVDSIFLSFDKDVENAYLTFLDLTTNKKITIKLSTKNNVWAVYKVRGIDLKQ